MYINWLLLPFVWLNASAVAEAFGMSERGAYKKLESVSIKNQGGSNNA